MNIFLNKEIKEESIIYTFPYSQEYGNPQNYSCFRELLCTLKSKMKDKIIISDKFRYKTGINAVEVQINKKDLEEFNTIMKKEIEFIEILAKLSEGLDKIFNKG